MGCARGSAAWGLVAWVALAACRPAGELPVYGRIQRLELETSLDASMQAEDLDGRIHVVDFIFTSCTMACPLMTERMRRFYDAFAAEEDLRFVSVSTDPENDTVATLHEYARKRGLDERRWIFARAPAEEARRLSEEEFLLPAADWPVGHTTRFVLVDGDRRLRGFYDSQSPDELETLERDVRALLAAVR